MKFRKLPVEIEAEKFTNQNKDKIFYWASSLQMNIYPSFETNNGEKLPCLVIPTLEGEMICSMGDYLIVEPFPNNNRKLYPCKPDIFEKTYEKCE